MRKNYNLLIVLTIPALFLLTTSEVLFHSGSPGGKSGSPGDNGANCTDCHSGTPVTEELWMYSPQLLIQGYSPGQVYQFFVVGIDSDASKFGFEATAEDASGNKVGTFQAGALGMTQTINNAKAITHTALGNVPIADTGTVWMFSWTAPNETVGTIGFYAAINAANGNGANTGDQIHLTSFMASPATSVPGRNDNQSLGLYPNPSSGLVHIGTTASRQANRLDVINLSGQLKFSRELQPGESKVDLSELEKGIYILRMGEQSQRLILK